MLKSSILKSSLLLVGVFFIYGCSSSNEPKPDSINSYIDAKRSLDDFEKADDTATDVMYKYLAKKEAQLHDKDNYKKGDNIVEFITNLVAKQNSKTIVVVEEIYKKLLFTKDAPTSFFNLREFISYINLSKTIPYIISVKSQGRFKKISFTSTDTLRSKLRKTKLSLANNMGILDALTMLATQLKITLDIDRYSKDLLSVSSPESINTDANSFLNNITTANNLFLTITKDTIKIHQLKSRVYDIFITPLVISAASQNSLDSADGSTAKSTGKQDTSLSFGYKIYDELKENIKTIVGKKGMYFLNQASGQLTVRTQKDNLELVDIIVQKFNDMYSKQIEMRMQILEVTLNEEHQNGIDFFIKGSSSSGKTGFSFGNKSDGYGIGGAVEHLTDAVLGSDGLVQNTAGAISRTFDVNMLNTYGEVSVVSTPVLKTLNSIPAILDVGLEEEYLSEVKTSVSDGVQETSTEVDIAKDGIKIYMYPRIVRDNEILLTITPQITSVVNLKDTGVNGTKTKTVNNRTFNSTLVFKNGETIMFAGLLTKYNKSDKQGMPWIDREDSWVDYAAGSKGGTKKKTELILVLTVRIINQ